MTPALRARRRSNHYTFCKITTEATASSMPMTPPPFSASAISAPLTWRAPASPRSWVASSASIRSFSANLNRLATQLADNDSSLREFLDKVPPAARTAASLIKELGAPLGVLVNNLTTTSQVFQANVGVGVDNPTANIKGVAVAASLGAGF